MSCLGRSRVHVVLRAIPQQVALNKADLPSAEAQLVKIGDYFRHQKRRTFTISAVTGQGVEGLIRTTYQLLQRINQKIREQQKSTPTTIEVSRAKKRFQISKDEHGYSVVGTQPKRAVLMTDLENTQALVMLHRKLKNMGVINALLKAGIKEGEDVYIHGFEFQFTVAKE